MIQSAERLIQLVEDGLHLTLRGRIGDGQRLDGIHITCREPSDAIYHAVIAWEGIQLRLEIVQLSLLRINLRLQGIELAAQFAGINFRVLPGFGWIKSHKNTS